MSNPRFLPPSCLFVSLACMVLLNLFIPVITLISYPWNAIGLVPMTLGIALNLIAGKTFIKNGHTIKAFEPPQKLITTGVYRYSRNPMYLGMVLILIGVAILLGSLSPFIIVPMLAITIDRIFIIAEENMLDEKFGDQWKQYKTDVRRWI